jgi:hypothetical protein
MDIAGGGLEFLAPACGGDALGGESETGGATEVCPLAPSCDQTPTKMRLKAKSVTLLIRILQTALVRQSTVRRVSGLPWSSKRRSCLRVSPVAM